MQLIIPSPARSGNHVRVGVYQNTPLTFEENGKTKGFFIDILEHIAGKEGWRIEYVHSSWPECLSNLKSGEIDLLGGIAYSETRGRIFDYTYESVITNWGQLYLNKKSDKDVSLFYIAPLNPVLKDRACGKQAGKATTI
jgi:ABC-type amino acid transport substrate-binding protein